MNPFAIPGTGADPVPGQVSAELPHGVFLPGLIDPLADTHRCLSEVVDTFKGQTRTKRVQVSLQFLARDYRLTRSPERLRQVFSSLMRTAVGSAPAGGQITIRSTCPGEGVLRVEVVEHRRGHVRRHPVH
jgi:signal transduction histidine kinase